uniref:ATP synthase complex subunit 8 n=1 Tax=Pyrgacris descampsi TaxID=1260745 RepID=M4JDU0_9ORTH|nr:ATP synthase F0 subunit 8 [Pyrgacris descampsi]AGC22338.1 ATP synthase F0 subunit 8 [Pyrgacris descampsi]
MHLIPQMSPIMWFTLFIVFSMVMIIFNQLTFFSFKNKINNSKEMLMLTSHKSTWKW